MTLLRTIGSPIIDVDRCVYLNTHAKHPINEKLEAKIRAKRIEMGLERAPVWIYPPGWAPESTGTVFTDNVIYGNRHLDDEFLFSVPPQPNEVPF